MDKRIFGRTSALAVVLIGIVACGGGSVPAGGADSAATISPQDPPVTLRLGIADPRGRQSDPAAMTFVQRVAERSAGNITIEPIFDAGRATDAKFEVGTNERVKAGDIELSISASRSWDLGGVKSLQALQAPMLIDSDALALAVAQSDIATRGLEGMAQAGLIGLSLWPEDLRHLFAFPGCDLDFSTPDGIAGMSINVIASQLSRDVITALGATIYTGTELGEDADACRVHGMETGLIGIGMPTTSATAMANVVLFPKYQVLAANAAAFGRLSVGQQSVIRQVAAETQLDAFTRQPVEAELARTWCDGGGTVDVASEAQVAAFQAAVTPVTAMLEQDALAKALIADIADLKAATNAPPVSQPCGPPSAIETIPPVDTTGYLATAIPDGTYRAELTPEALLASGVSSRFASINWGVKTLTFAGDTVALDQGVNGGTPCYGTYVVGAKYLIFTTERGGCGFDGHYLWREEGDGIALLLLPQDGYAPQAYIEDGAYFTRVWSRVE